MSVDYATFEKLVDWHVRQKPSSLCVILHIAESVSLTIEEHKKLIEISVKVTNGRVPVIANVSSAGTEIAIDLARHSEKVGADAHHLPRTLLLAGAGRGAARPLLPRGQGEQPAVHDLQLADFSGHQPVAEIPGAPDRRAAEFHRRERSQPQLRVFHRSAPPDAESAARVRPHPRRRVHHSVDVDGRRRLDVDRRQRGAEPDAEAL